MLAGMRWVFRWLARRSLATLHTWGGWLGRATWLLSPSYRRRFAENAARAGLTPAEQGSAVREAGKLAAELPWLWLGAAARPISPHCSWRGETLIDDALAAGRGLVLLTPHMGSFEVCAQAYAERWGGRWPMTALYRPSRKAALRELEETARARPGLLTAPASLAGVRQMLRALKKAQTVGLLPDQVPPAGQGVWAPFFGERAYTMTLATRLVRQTGAALLLMWAERLGGARGWVLHVSAPSLPLPAASSDEADAAFVNCEMERLIRERPSQYLWGYHRYKAPREA
jgi:KDO2-lipid IV(A) lauroyltransferase